MYINDGYSNEICYIYTLGLGLATLFESFKDRSCLKFEGGH